MTGGSASGKRISSVPVTKLAETDVLKIQHLRQTGTKYRELARRFNVFVTIVGQICTGRKWKHVGGKINRPLHGAEAFWSRVDKNGGPDRLKWETVGHAEGDGSSCWIWLGCKTDGYGMMTIQGEQLLTHRYVWMLENGPIPDEICVCHYCDHRDCVRPDHLFLGTHIDYGTYTSQKGHCGSYIPKNIPVVIIIMPAYIPRNYVLLLASRAVRPN